MPSVTSLLTAPEVAINASSSSVVHKAARVDLVTDKETKAAAARKAKAVSAANVIATKVKNARMARAAANAVILKTARNVTPSPSPACAICGTG